MNGEQLKNLTICKLQEKFFCYAISQLLQVGSKKGRPGRWVIQTTPLFLIFKQTTQLIIYFFTEAYLEPPDHIQTKQS